MNSIMARLEISVAVLFKRVGIKAVSLLNEFVIVFSEKKVNPILAWMVLIDCLAELIMASGSARKVLIFGLIKVIARNTGKPIRKR